MMQSNHPFVLSIDYIFQNDYRIYFFMKYIKGGTMFDCLVDVKRFPESTCRFYGAQIALALAYIHSLHVVHRDIKPENLLIDQDGYLYLSDFGLSKFIEGTQQTFSFKGTAEYLAPEILDQGGHGFSVDWWTLGVLLYEMATGRPPFMDKNHLTLGLLIREGRIIFPDPNIHKI